MPDCFWKVETILPSTKEEAGLAFGSNLPISLKLGKHPVFFFFLRRNGRRIAKNAAVVFDSTGGVHRRP